MLSLGRQHQNKFSNTLLVFRIAWFLSVGKPPPTHLHTWESLSGSPNGVTLLLLPCIILLSLYIYEGEKGTISNSNDLQWKTDKQTSIHIRERSEIKKMNSWDIQLHEWVPKALNQVKEASLKGCTLNDFIYTFWERQNHLDWQKVISC